VLEPYPGRGRFTGPRIALPVTVQNGGDCASTSDI
jgi:hypothetical protein